MGGCTKVAVPVDTQVTDGVDWFNGRTSDRDGTARKLRLPTRRRTPQSPQSTLVGIELEPIGTHPAGNLVDENRNFGRQSGDSDDWRRVIG